MGHKQHQNLMYQLNELCLVWTLLLCIWKTDGFAWLYVCVSLNLVTCVFYYFLHVLVHVLDNYLKNQETDIPIITSNGFRCYLRLVLHHNLQDQSANALC